MIEIKGEKTGLFVHDNSQPALILNDLMFGTDSGGDIVLWIGPGIEAHFSNWVVTKID